MSDWLYSYKTSDGLRHEGRMEAPTRDDVYRELRTRGIRAIRVDAATSSPEPPSPRIRSPRRRPFAAIVLIVLGAALAVALPRLFRSVVPSAALETPHPAAHGTSREFAALVACVERLRAEHVKSESLIDRALLSAAPNEEVSDGDRVEAEIAKGHRLVELSRAKIRKDFYPVYRRIPESNARERYEAQRLYGGLMADVDATEEWLLAVENLASRKSR